MYSQKGDAFRLVTELAKAHPDTVAIFVCRLNMYITLLTVLVYRYTSSIVSVSL